jgi:hypothetical protein
LSIELKECSRREFKLAQELEEKQEKSSEMEVKISILESKVETL